MSRAIYQSVENPEQLFGDTEDLIAYNHQKGGTLLIENNEALDILDKGELLIMPSTTPVKNEQKKTKKKDATKKEKIINIAALQDGKPINIQVKQKESEAPMVMQSVVGDGSLGYSSPSMIKTEEQDPLEHMRQCGEEQEDEQQETPLTIPKVISE